MNPIHPPTKRSTTIVMLLPMTYALLRWMAQPPMQWGWLSFVAIVPLLFWIDCQPEDRRRTVGDGQTRSRRRRLRHCIATYRGVWFAAFVFWMVSLQGLRHAHPLMFLGWIALAGYLAVYSVAFVAIVRRLRQTSLPMVAVVPMTWVACEWVRNYMLTGISACMLGHSLADYPVLIQIADLGGTYAVSFVIAIVNAGVWRAIRPTSPAASRSLKPIAVSISTAIAVLIVTIGYGVGRLNQQSTIGHVRFALLGLDEQTEYEQDVERETRIFQNYVRATIDVVADSDQPIHAIVWPESMFSGGQAWMIAKPDAVVPDDAEMTQTEFRERIALYRAAYDSRNADLQRMLPLKDDQKRPPHFLFGGPVIEYGDRMSMFSGLVHVSPDRTVDWYGKTHLVVFGETIPILSTWSTFRSFLPAGLGLATGPGAKVFDVDGVRVLGSICIETAVERIAVNQIARLRPSVTPDVIVTVTNDAWFDHSSVVEHHLRCAQLVAVACRKPLLSTGNGGPTAWIDSHGRIVSRIANGQAGHLIATPAIDDRESLYVRIGSWPAGLMTLIVLVWLWRAQQKRRVEPSPHASSTQSDAVT